jgi:hypothetical protein
MTLLLLHHKIKKCQIKKIKAHGQANKTYFFYFAFRIIIYIYISIV